MKIRVRPIQMLLMSLALALGLLFSPGTRWLALEQIRMHLFLPRAFNWTLHNLSPLTFSNVASPGATLLLEESRPLATAVHRHLDDFQMRMASTLWLPTSNGLPEASEKVRRLHTLTSLFPDRPDLYATLLRYEVAGGVMIHRKELNLLLGLPLPTISLPTPDSDRQAQFDVDAVQGEKVDPDNAYFPLMRAVGLFAEHHDQEALAAVRRAGQKSHWNDYTDAEPEAEWRLMQAAFSERSVLLYIPIRMSEMLPHYAQCRMAAGIATYGAMESEKEGRKDEGIAIRHNLMQLAHRMRSESPNLFGVLASSELAETAALRPGGSVAIPQPPSLSIHLWRKKQAAQYSAYLRANRHEAEARWVEFELLSARREWDENSDSLSETTKLLRRQSIRLTGWWMVDLLTLANVLWMLIFTGAAILLARLRRPREALPLLAVPMCLLGAFLLFRQVSWIMALTTLREEMQRLGLGTMVSVPSTGSLKMALFCSTFAVPLLFMFVTGLIAITSPTPAVENLLRGLRNITTPILFALVLLYSGLVMVTAREEAATNTELQEALQPPSQSHVI